MLFCQAVEKLLGYAQERLGLLQRDVDYTRNRMLAFVGADEFSQTEATYQGECLRDLLDAFIASGVRLGYFTDEMRERIEDGVMNTLMLSPSSIEREFEKQLKISGKHAMDWLYQYSIDSCYVKKDKLDGNPRFTAKNGLIVTINLAKPEFRDAKRAEAGNRVQGGYPNCTICRENEGFLGRNKGTLRTVTLRLNGKKWFWQYSPYGYFYQHGIAVNQIHTPMHVDRGTFECLMDFADQFPHFFIGCNAPLPRIGGSVLAHDHFQGGGERLPIFNAPAFAELRHETISDVSVFVLDWYGTAVRIVGSNRESIIEASEVIRGGWENYRNDRFGIVSNDSNGVHSAVSPTLVKTAYGYEMTLILRNNITSKRYPDGVFHAHPEFHFIKKESIGLIEAQGLFILPGRLKEQLSVLEDILVNGDVLPSSLSDFSLMYEEIIKQGDAFTHENAKNAIQDELASICERILKNTAVFQTHEDTVRFLQELRFL